LAGLESWTVHVKSRGRERLRSNFVALVTDGKNFHDKGKITETTKWALLWRIGAQVTCRKSGKGKQ